MYIIIDHETHNGMKKGMELDIDMKTYVDFWSDIELWATVFVRLSNIILAKQINYLIDGRDKSPSASIGSSYFLKKEDIFLRCPIGNWCILTVCNKKMATHTWGFIGESGGGGIRV